MLSKQLVDRNVKQFLNFVNHSPSPFHAVHESKKLLQAAGFQELKEKDSWDGQIKPSGKYFFTRNQSSIVAFAVGGKFKPGNGVGIVAAHTDSPCLKVKPISKINNQGYQQVGVQTYGGGLWHTWFDRDLSLAGRVMIEENGKYVGRLVRVDEAILRIPTLAIHLDRGVNDGFTFNKETHLVPILATIGDELSVPEPKTDDKDAPHHPNLIKKLASNLNVEPTQIKDFELCLFDTQPSAVGGLNNEFIFSPRLDNLMMSYTCLEGLLTSLEEHDLSHDSRVRMICLFDNEEVGSMSAYGADSLMLETTLRRLQVSKENPTSFEESVHHSYLISADMAHAIHPNYSEKHEKNHKPKMHHGVVVKINANQRYATTSSTSLLLKHIAESKSIPLQEFVVRNDSPCGSTIGPILSSKLGLRTIDVGCPQLSMHSIRETAGTQDVTYAVELFKEFFGTFEPTDNSILID